MHHQPETPKSNAIGDIANATDDGSKKTADPYETNTTVSKTTAIILILAIGVHALFEGIAFGLQKTMENIGQLGAGIVIHKSAAAVSLGGAFARTGYSTKAIVLFLILFALTTPLGIIIGMSISHGNAIVDTIFAALSGGTFIYVSCSEIIVHEFDKGQYQWIKVLLVFIGGATITSMWFFGPTHTHGEGGHAHLLLRALLEGTD